MNCPNRNMAQLCVQHTNIKRIVNMDWDTHYDAVIESSVWLHNDPPTHHSENKKSHKLVSQTRHRHSYDECTMSRQS